MVQSVAQWRSIARREIGDVWRTFSAWWTSNGWEPIGMRAERFNYLPDRFVWRGELHHVCAVVGSWERLQRGIPRRFFAIECADGTYCTLVHDLQNNLWHRA